MFKPFDSYVEDGKLIIVTTDYVGDEREVILNTIRLERAKEIVKDLQEAIKLLEKPKVVSLDFKDTLCEGCGNYNLQCTCYEKSRDAHFNGFR